MLKGRKRRVGDILILDLEGKHLGCSVCGEPIEQRPDGIFAAEAPVNIVVELLKHGEKSILLNYENFQAASDESLVMDAVRCFVEARKQGATVALLNSSPRMTRSIERYGIDDALACFDGEAVAVGSFQMSLGKQDEALETFTQAKRLQPGDLSLDLARWEVFTTKADWGQADECVRAMEASHEPLWQWQCFLCQAISQLYHGQSRKSLEFLEKAVSTGHTDNLRTGQASYAAHVLLESEQTVEALEKALEDYIIFRGPQVMRDESSRPFEFDRRGGWGVCEGIFYAAIALSKLGHVKSARTLLQELPTGSDILYVPHHRVLGEIALLNGDRKLAEKEFRRAHAQLAYQQPLRRRFLRFPQRVPNWFSLGSIHLAEESKGGRALPWKLRDEELAADWFQLIAESTFERVYWPILYVRSFYFLGKIHENRAEMGKAREYYRRFYEYWKNGDIDRERVEEARKKIES